MHQESPKDLFLAFLKQNKAKLGRKKTWTKTKDDDDAAAL